MPKSQLDSWVGITRTVAPKLVITSYSIHYTKLYEDEFRKLGVRANADYPVDAQRARDYGAEGIGLCRSEHMFFEAERLPFVQRMIMTDLPLERREALEAVLPFQRKDFIGLFRVMDGLPVIIRLLDPPLHEFLPSHSELQRELTDIKIRLQHAA